MPASNDPRKAWLAGPLSLAQLGAQPMMAGGCYLIDLAIDRQPLDVGHWIGTLRVERHPHVATISGDLYAFRPGIDPPDPTAGIPAFAHDRYSDFARGLQLLAAPGPARGLRLRLGRQRLDLQNERWTVQPDLELALRPVASPSGWPSAADYWTGDVEDVHGNPVGRVQLGQLSETFRKARVEIDRVAASPLPLASGQGDDWAQVFATVDWQITAFASDTDLVKPDDRTTAWSRAELHETMLLRRGPEDAGGTWRFYLACVEDVAEANARGVMFDAGGTDSDNMPREGAAIESGWRLPKTITSWKALRKFLGFGRRKTVKYGQVDILYFRTALHEIGHTMGLDHSEENNFLMNVTDNLAARGAESFPSNVLFKFRADDEQRLRHWPDPYVRPGGVRVDAWGFQDAATLPSPDAEVRIKVRPLQPVVPLGAPVRIQFEVENRAAGSVWVPSLTLKSDRVRGKVVGPGGEERNLRTIMRWLDGDEAGTTLPEGASTSHWITLLRGPEGALFPAPGLHRIVIELRREQADGTKVMAAGHTHILITSADSSPHNRVVHHVLSCPDTLLVLVLGGRHLKQGIKAIETALSDRVLRRHFGVVEAKRRGGLGKPLKRVLEVLDKHTVMSVAELRRLAELVRDRRQKAGNKKAFMKKKAHRKLVKLLRYHAGKLRPFDKGLEKKIRKIIYR